MKTIYKYSLAITDRSRITMPEGAEFLTVQAQGNGLVLWAIVEPENASKVYYFEIFGTGHPMEERVLMERKYISTVQLQGLVWHVFHRKL